MQEFCRLFSADFASFFGKRIRDMSLFVSIFYDQGSGAVTQGLLYSLTRWESCI